MRVGAEFSFFEYVFEDGVRSDSNRILLNNQGDYAVWVQLQPLFTESVLCTSQRFELIRINPKTLLSLDLTIGLRTNEPAEIMLYEDFHSTRGAMKVFLWDHLPARGEAPAEVYEFAIDLYFGFNLPAYHGIEAISSDDVKFLKPPFANNHLLWVYRQRQGRICK